MVKNMYHTILTAIDGSDTAYVAARHAANLAAAVDARLHVLYVMETKPAFTRYGLSGIETDELESRQRALADEALAEAKGIAGEHEVECVTVTKTGPAHQKIIDYAGDIGADVIVVGASGRDSLGDVVLGSTTDRVVRAATIPVLVVHG